MDRGKVQHVEAHPGDVGQALDAVAERAMHAGCRAARARKHLVPRAEARALAIDEQGKFDRKSRRETSVGVPHRDRAEFLVQREDPQRSHVVHRPHLLRPPQQLLTIAAVRALRGGIDEIGATACGDPQIVGVDAARKIVTPGKEVVDPGGHRVAIATQRGDVNSPCQRSLPSGTIGVSCHSASSSLR